MIRNFTEAINITPQECEQKITAATGAHARYISDFPPGAPGKKSVQITWGEPNFTDADLLKILLPGAQAATVRPAGLKLQKTMHAKTELTNEEIAIKIERYYDLDRGQVVAEKNGDTIKITMLAPEPADEDLKKAIFGNGLLTWNLDGKKESEEVMAEKDVQQAQMTQLIETMKSLFGLDKIVEWLKSQVQTLLDELKRVVADYKIKVEAQDVRLAAIEEKEQKAVETAQIRATANDESLNKLRADLKAAMAEINALKARLNNAAVSADALSKNLKG